MPILYLIPMECDQAPKCLFKQVNDVVSDDLGLSDIILQHI